MAGPGELLTQSAGMLAQSNDARVQQQASLHAQNNQILAEVSAQDKDMIFQEGLLRSKAILEQAALKEQGRASDRAVDANILGTLTSGQIANRELSIGEQQFATSSATEIAKIDLENRQLDASIASAAVGEDLNERKFQVNIDIAEQDLTLRELGLNNQHAQVGTFERRTAIAIAQLFQQNTFEKERAAVEYGNKKLLAAQKHTQNLAEYEREAEDIRTRLKIMSDGVSVKLMALQNEILVSNTGVVMEPRKAMQDMQGFMASMTGAAKGIFSVLSGDKDIKAHALGGKDLTELTDSQLKNLMEASPTVSALVASYAQNYRLNKEFLAITFDQFKRTQNNASPALAASGVAPAISETILRLDNILNGPGAQAADELIQKVSPGSGNFITDDLLTPEDEARLTQEALERGGGANAAVIAGRKQLGF